MPKLSLVVSNVRGPDVTLYMAGARMVAHLPISIVLDGVTLNCTGFSYAGTLWVCALACREVLPDPAFFAECLRGSFEDLKRAAAERVARETLAVRDEPIQRAGPTKPPSSRPARRAVIRKRRGQRCVGATPDVNAMGEQPELWTGDRATGVAASVHLRTPTRLHSEGRIPGDTLTETWAYMWYIPEERISSMIHVWVHPT
jgi:hypothetical protein